jgi:hypothetical protein
MKNKKLKSPIIKKDNPKNAVFALIPTRLPGISYKLLR